MQLRIIVVFNFFITRLREVCNFASKYRKDVKTKELFNNKMDISVYIITSLILLSILHYFLRRHVIKKVKKKFPEYFKKNDTLTWLDIQYYSLFNFFDMYKFKKLVKNDKSLLRAIRILLLLDIVVLLLILLFIGNAIKHFFK